MYRGLQQVVPEAVLHLLTWHELERRICGDPDITIDALRKSSKSRATKLSVVIISGNCNKKYILINICWFIARRVYSVLVNDPFNILVNDPFNILVDDPFNRNCYLLNQRIHYFNTHIMYLGCINCMLFMCIIYSTCYTIYVVHIAWNK